MSKTNKNIEVNVRERILRPVGEDFDAVVDPEKMSIHVISVACEPMRPSPETWEFGDLGAKAAINMLDVEHIKKIA